MLRMAALALCLVGCAGDLAGQLPPNIRLGAHGVLSATQTSNVAGGRSLRELRFEQTMLMASALLLANHLEIVTTLSLDRATADDGVLTLGAWGGGFYDRHHPHEYLGEAVASIVGDVGVSAPRPRVSLSAGKGMVPFGPDAPMDRAAVRSPASHHWSQIMERWFGAFAMRGSRGALELAVFDGGGHAHASAPEHGGHAGHGPCTPCETEMSTTSGAARVTLWPASAVEVRVSGAMMRAPAHHPGAGSAHRMLNLVAMVHRSTRLGAVNGMLEYGQVRIDETFRTILGEGQLRRDRFRGYYRAERTDRAEGARADRFRSAPEIRENGVGITRWTIHTLGAAFRSRIGRFGFEPIVEVGFANVTSVGAVPIDVDALYGRRSLWSGVVAMRTTMGSHRRMGSYGAMTRPIADHGHH